MRQGKREDKIMAFRGPDPLDLLEDAAALREPLALDSNQVVDLLEALPAEDDFLSFDDIRERLARVDVKALKISRKARDEIAAAFGLDAEDIWTA